MNSTVLADTGPLYALADPSDQFHPRAVAELKTIERRGFTIAISYPTLCEAHTLILRKLGGAYSRQWLSEVLAGAHLLNPEVADYALAAERLERFPDQLITLVDAVTATMSRRLGVAVWTFDRHFATMRSAVWAK
jgi:predicted nucleic acid-binding protein